MAKVGIQSAVTVTATLAGQPGSIEKINSITISDPSLGTASISADGLSGSIDWLAAGTGVVVSVEADNIQGAVVGALKGDSVPFDVLAADVVLADAITVGVA